MGREGCDLIDMVVGPRQNGCSGGCTDSIRTEAVVKAHALVGDPIEIRRPIDPTAVATHGMGSVVVGHDEQNVWLVAHVNSI
jgi:hypothetical protein